MPEDVELVKNNIIFRWFAKIELKEKKKYQRSQKLDSSRCVNQ